MTFESFLNKITDLFIGVDYSLTEFDSGARTIDLKLSEEVLIVLQIASTEEIGVSCISPKESDFGGADEVYQSYEETLASLLKLKDQIY